RFLFEERGQSARALRSLGAPSPPAPRPLVASAVPAPARGGLPTEGEEEPAPKRAPRLPAVGAQGRARLLARRRAAPPVTDGADQLDKLAAGAHDELAAGT